MKFKMLSATAVVLFSSVLTAHAATTIHTATIDKSGTIVTQSSSWIKEVKHFSQDNYFASYEVMVAPGVFKRAPAFCAVSTIDSSDNDKLLYGQVKLGKQPTAEKVNVVGLLMGNNGPSGDSSQSFQLACAE